MHSADCSLVNVVRLQLDGYEDPQDVLVLRTLLTEHGKLRLARTEQQVLHMLPLDISAVYAPDRHSTSARGRGNAAGGASAAAPKERKRNFRGSFELAPDIMLEELLSSLDMLNMLSLDIPIPLGNGTANGQYPPIPHPQRVRRSC
jgi:hypothetical protein